MDFDLLQGRIMLRIWRCNELSKKQAEDYAAIAIQEIKGAVVASSLKESGLVLLHEWNEQTAKRLGAI